MFAFAFLISVNTILFVLAAKTTKLLPKKDNLWKNDFAERLKKYITNNPNVKVNITDNTVVLDVKELYGNLGNYLTRYYNIRGAAKYLGYGFTLYSEEELTCPGPFINYFPQHFDPPSEPELLKLRQLTYNQLLEAQTTKEFFNRCYDLRYPHDSNFLWTLMFDEMKSEIQAASKAFLVENAIEVSYEPGQCVIHSRLSEDVILAHANYGPNAFSLYLPLIQSCKEIILIYYQDVALAKEIHDALEEYILELNPEIILTKEKYSDPIEAFVNLVFAPVLAIEASTFSLMAGLGNEGIIVSPHLWPNNLTFDRPNWIWSNAPVVYPSADGTNRKYYGEYADLNKVSTSVYNGPTFKDNQKELFFRFLREN